MDPHQPAPTTPQRWAFRALLVVGCALGLRAGTLALAPHPPEPVVASRAAGQSHRILESPKAPAKPSTTRRLSIDEYAALYGLCPTAVDELPAELLPERLVPPHQKTALKPKAAAEAGGTPGPRGRLTGVRVASRSMGPSLGLAGPRFAQVDEPADGWLVAPEEWFAPEDQPPVESVTPPTEPSEPTEPAAPAEPAGAEPPRGGLPESFEPPASAQPPTEGNELAAETTPWPVEPPADTGPAYPETDRLSQPEAPRLEARPALPAAESANPVVPEVEDDSVFGPSFAPPGVSTQPAEEPVPPPAFEPVPEPPAPMNVAPPMPRDPEPAAEPTRDWEGPFDSVVPPRKGRPRESIKPEPVREPARDRPLFDEPPAAESLPVPPADLPAPPPAPPAAESLSESIAPPEPVATPEPVPVEPEVIPAKPRTPAKPLFAAPTPKRQPVSTTGPTHPGGGEKAKAEAQAAAGGKSADESHRELFAKNNYPSAQDCAACHQRIYDEWSVSSHAYAFVSPMYHRFEETLTQLSQGTVGHFCQRCHSPVATAMYEPRSTPVGHMAKAAKEGVTCIVCHRVNQRWGKSNGDRRIEPGDVYAPVYGGVGGDGVAAAIADKKKYKVKTSPDDKGPGQAIHTEGRFFDQLTKAEACTSCHQVAVHPGVKLEVVWEQYRASPACKKGVTCQDCHMGRVPGLAQGYNYGPIAELNGKTVNNHRKQSSHIFYGPGYSIAHPGIFPHNKDADDWAFDEWMCFDWRAGWGTDEFEEKIDEYEDQDIDTSKWFPPAWADTDDRADAREVVEDNLERLKTKRRYRELVMENGSKVDGPFFRSEPFVGQDLKFEYVVANQNEGHNLPTASLGAQPQLWANVVLIDPHGRRVWESGYTDSNGDLCDIHSVDVRHGRIPFDKQLFNLQTMFLISGATGTDREFYLPVNLDIDQVAHLRPGALPITVLNHPPFIRMESRSLAPLGKKRVKYTVPAELMRQPGKYRLSFRLRNRTEPMYFMRLCKSTPEMLRAMTEGTLDIHPQSVEFYVR